MEIFTLNYRYMLSFLMLFRHTLCWHGADQFENKLYHCWIDNPSVETTLEDCPGFKMAWTPTPPTEVRSEDKFLTNYTVIIEDKFYEWAVNETGNVFPSDLTYKSVNVNTNWTVAKDWCENQDCPEYTDKPEDCCFWHLNVHSCPSNQLDDEAICGPWVPPNGTIFVHSIALVGKGSKESMWSSEIKLTPVGDTSIIAHIKIGNFQAALHHQITVLEKFVCGDGNCDEIESCSNCPADCGNCPLTDGEIAGIVVVIVIVVFLFCAIITYFYWKQRKMLWDESWIINYNDIEPDRGLRGFMGSVITINRDSSDTDAANSTATGMTLAAQVKQIFTQTGIYKGQTVAVRNIEKNVFHLTKAIRKEVKQIRDLNHPNLCKFIGGCIEMPNIAILSEYCPKGSLNDILLNDDIPLNWGFRFSFCQDIARGISHLHQNKIYHGRLKSSNCIVDDRWVVKIADYGLPIFRKEEKSIDESSHKFKAAQVYLAPEYITYGSSLLPSSSGDVYSFGVILVEIATRNEPYDSDDLTNIDGYWRPELPNLGEYQKNSASTDDHNCPSPIEYVEVIKSCWMHNPNQRPNIAQIKLTLARINPSKLSPVDMMMQMMEKYSKHLEVLVAERTQDLVLEKQKTDRLLYSMLPKPIADDLRQGKSAEAKYFDSCTIFFSDIVGFTSLSGESTPYQVVELLNKLYVTFDSIIDVYDVYKVETIGDAYMVVSGVPNENGIEHAGQIASMALDLISVCETFSIPHKPDKKLRIRAGIHSGNVVAGVVGIKMPRYCLFGDTVNTASRMESTGEALKIQASDFCVDYLEQLGGYKTEFRGELPVKGKGVMRTWWIVGKYSNAKNSENRSKPLLKPNVEAIILEEKDNKTKKLSLEERSDEEERKISLPGSIEEKDINEENEKSHQRMVFPEKVSIYSEANQFPNNGNAEYNASNDIKDPSKVTNYNNPETPQQFYPNRKEAYASNITNNLYTYNNIDKNLEKLTTNFDPNNDNVTKSKNKYQFNPIEFTSTLYEGTDINVPEIEAADRQSPGKDKRRKRRGSSAKRRTKQLNDNPLTETDAKEEKFNDPSQGQPYQIRTASFESITPLLDESIL